MDHVTVRDHYTIFTLYGFIGDSFGEVDCEENGIHLPANWIKGSFKENCKAC